MKDNIPDLKFERLIDGRGEGLIMLEQYDNGEETRVAIHPIHLRYLAEKMGLIEAADPQAAKVIAKLERRLRLLRDRIDHMGDYLVNHSDQRHADLSYEITYMTATADLADEFCAEFESNDKSVEHGQLELIAT